MTAAGRRDPHGVRPAVRRTPSIKPDDLAKDRLRALALAPVSRETLARLDRFVTLLLDWQQRVNLIAPSTQPVLWTRHVADSLQLLPLAPDAQSWVDLGSGAGFPGVVIACALADVPGASAHLVESNMKKAAFLGAAVEALGVPAVVHPVNIGEFLRKPPARIEVVTARALAPLPDLLRFAHPLLKKGALGLFPKGQAVEAELTEAAKYWNIQATLVPSRTDPKARIVVVRGVEPRAGSRLETTPQKR